MKKEYIFKAKCMKGIKYETHVQTILLSEK